MRIGLTNEIHAHDYDRERARSLPYPKLLSFTIASSIITLVSGKPRFHMMNTQSVASMPVQFVRLGRMPPLMCTLFLETFRPAWVFLSCDILVIPGSDPQN